MCGSPIILLFYNMEALQKENADLKKENLSKTKSTEGQFDRPPSKREV